MFKLLHIEATRMVFIWHVDAANIYLILLDALWSSNGREMDSMVGQRSDRPCRCRLRLSILQQHQTTDRQI